MAEFKDTQEQALAKTTDRHLSLTANAGSGKTTVLVDRFLNLVLGKNHLKQRIDPKKITAITFTKMAATEMTERIVSKVNKMIANSKNETEQIRLTEIRTKLSSARIATIHSFCGSLLREYPIEAKVSPNFKELSGADLLIIQNQSVFSAIEKRLFGISVVENSDSSAIEQKKNETVELIKSIGGRKRLEEILLAILRNRRIYTQAKKYYDLDISELRKNRTKEFSAIFFDLIKRFEEMYRRASEAWTEEKLKKSYAKIQNVSHKTARLFDEINILLIRDEISNITWEKVCSLIQEFIDAVSQILTPKRDLSATYINVIEDSFVKREFENLYKEIKQLSEIIENSKYDEEQFKLSKYFVNLANDAITIYDNEKKEIEGLDFDDLIEKTDALLDNENVRAKINSRIEYLLVDEFQDTDELQYSIVKKIIRDISEESTSYGNNLFIVGDPKQSIYGFRNADVRVFEKAKKDINNANTKRINRNTLSPEYEIVNEIDNGIVNEIVKPETDEESAGNLKLSSTFRLMPEVGNFVNYICSELFDYRRSEFDVEYDELVCAKKIEELIGAKKNPETNNSSEFGDVNFIVAVKPYNKADAAIDSTENCYKTENELICDYIIKSVNEGKAVYQDFGILCRSAKPLDELAKVMIERRIPFINHSGGGFFAIPEIQDLIALLKFLINNSDDISLLTVLKSSFCGFTNTELFMLSQIPQSTTYFEKLKSISISNSLEIANEEFQMKATLCLNILEELISLRLDLPPTLLIVKALEKFNWYNIIKSSPFATKIKINVEKFLTLTRSYFNRGFKNLYDFVDELEYITQNEIKESEAAIKSNDNVVNLMTIHASKGLEFKNVILINTASRTGAGATTWYSFDEKMGINFKFTKQTDEGTLINDAVSSQYLIAKNIEKKKDKAEEKRILYVAMTRAENTLNIACTLKEKQPDSKEDKVPYVAINNTILQSITQSLNLDYTQLATENLISRNHCTLKILRSIDGKFVIGKLLYKMNVGIIRDDVKLYQIESIQDISVSNDYKPILLPDILTGKIECEFISASRLMKYLEHRGDYAKKFILGIPESDPTEVFFNQDIDKEDSYSNEEHTETISAANLGTAIHYVFEHVNLWLKENIINEDELNALISTALDNFHFNTEEYNSLLFSICQATTTSSLIQSRAEQLLTSKSEYSLYFTVGDDFIQGIIDLLIKNDDGEYEVWDWKSNVINDNLTEKALSYETQMKLYAYFIYRLAPNQKIYKSKLLFVRQSIGAITDEAWTYTFRWTAEELKKFELELFDLIKEIKNYPFLDLRGY